MLKKKRKELEGGRYNLVIEGTKHGGASYCKGTKVKEP